MAVLPPYFMECVIAIGVPNADETKEPRWVATGFLYGEYTSGHGSERLYRVYLVTNRHVFDGLAEAVFRHNALQGEPTRRYRLKLRPEGKQLWFAHRDPEVDIAVLPVNAQYLKDQGVKVGFFKEDDHVADTAKMRDIGLHEGDGAFILGFPLGDVGSIRNFTIVKGGHIARVQDLLAGMGKHFLLDALVFPGNSGGPVVSKPEMAAIEGTKAQRTSFLIGVVAGYVPYEDVAVSQQTGRPRIVFEENSGLTVAFPIDCVQAVIADINAVRIPKKPQEATPVAEPPKEAPSQVPPTARPAPGPVQEQPPPSRPNPPDIGP